MDLEVLIERVASAQDAAREAAATAKAANAANHAANDRLEAAWQELRKETGRRINELSPPQEGDRV